MEYTILIHQAEEGGFWSEVPALPGCYSQGETLDEALHNTKEAIESYLIALKEDQVVSPNRREPFHWKSPGGSCGLVIQAQHSAAGSRQPAFQYGHRRAET